MTIQWILRCNNGVSLSEVLVAIAVLPLGLMGAMVAFHAAQQTITQGTLSSRALTMAESRLEAKRSSHWTALLEDDLDHDGLFDHIMRDDGQEGDLVAGDGTYSSSYEQDEILLTWTVTPSRVGHLMNSGSVVIESRAAFQTAQGKREVKMATMRANPLFVGP